MAKQVKNLKRRELLLEYFTSIAGCSVDPDKSTGKYICLVTKAGERLFLGGAGALRKGTSVSSSLSLTDRLTEEYMEKVRERVQAHRDAQKIKK